jgi:hypothetical protein
MADLDKKPNPLTAFFRQPKIYISLPSKGEFYPAGTLEPTENNEFPVYAMTARDELLFKTPDALMNGAATVEVIKSCIPNIKDPWKMPSIDVDAALCAIRIATSGEEMSVDTMCPKCNHGNDRSIDLRILLDNFNKIRFSKRVEIGSELLINLRPMTYDQMSKTAVKTFEHQRIFQIVNDESISEPEKIRLFQESFIKLTDITFEVVANCIESIESSAGNTNDIHHIKEFLKNCDKSVFTTINETIDASKETSTIPTLDTKCDKCEHEYKIELTLDQSDFFGQGFRN